jgi:hypothetical protein
MLVQGINFLTDPLSSSDRINASGSIGTCKWHLFIGRFPFILTKEYISRPDLWSINAAQKMNECGPVISTENGLLLSDHRMLLIQWS